MKRRRGAPPPTRVFRPTIPTRRELWAAMFFAVLSLVGVFGWVREGKGAALAVGLAMTFAASWLAYRGRLFGRPTLIVEPDRVRFLKSGREVSARWSDIEHVSFGPYLRRELWFVRRSGAPIRVSDSMTTADGVRFDMVIEDYVETPASAGG